MPLLSARPAVTLATQDQFRCLVNRGTMGVNSLPKTVTRQRRGRDLNPGPSAPESSTISTRLLSGVQAELIMPAKAFARDYGITGVRLSVCQTDRQTNVRRCLFVCYHDN